MSRIIKKILAITLVTYLLVELVCFIFISTKFKAAHFPEFRFQYRYDVYDFPFAEINPVWGTWHYRETYTERKSCFKSVYHINSFGARDRERVVNADTNRVIFLGDSFIEGYGLSEADRLTNQLERSSGKEVLNFACGYFTPTQEYLVYENLAKKFSHETVVIGILPFNDLKEDDSSFREQDRFTHYQPYFQGTDPNYQLIYREKDLSRSTFNKEGYYALQNTGKQRISRFLKEFSFWYNIYQFIWNNKPAKNPGGKPYSGYYDHTQAQLDKLKFVLQKLQDAVAGKQLIVVTIPVENDLHRYKTGDQPQLSIELSDFCRARGIGYTDLLPAFAKIAENPRQLYLSCDGHWNATANKIAAEIILPLLGK